MSNHDSSKTDPKRNRRRLVVPMVVAMLTAVGLAGLYFWPDPGVFRAMRVVVGYLIFVIAAGLIAIWFLCFSGIRWRTRIIVSLSVLVLGSWGMASIRKVELDGDMVATFHFRWNPSEEELLESHRAQSKSASDRLDVVRISGDESNAFPEYRGRNRDGVVTGPELERDWKAKPPRFLWGPQPVGGGYAAFVVLGNLLVTIEQRRDEEAVVGYDAQTGLERWVHSYPALFEEWQGGPGPRATPTIAEGKVYSLGAAGDLIRLDASSGEREWAVNILEENGTENIQWGMSGSPLVIDDVVVVNPGVNTENGSATGLVAYDRQTGKRVWGAGKKPAGYSSPMIATFAGLRQILIFDGHGLAGHDLQTGAELWRHRWNTPKGINVAQPLVLPGDRIFISSGYNTGCVVVEVKESSGKWSVREIWQKNRFLRCKFNNPVAKDGYVYGLDDGILVCLDLETGQRQWKKGRYGHGQLLLSGDLLLILSERGEIALVEASPEEYRELGRQPVLEGRKTWNCPILADGRLFIRNHRQMVGLDLRRND